MKVHTRRALDCDRQIIRVLHVLGTIKPSGMERMLLSAAAPFRELHVESSIIAQGADHRFAEELSNSRYRIYIVSTLRSAKGLLQLFLRIRAVRPDILHIHTEGAFGPVVIAARLAHRRMRVVRTVHNIFGGTRRGKISRLVQSWIADPLVSEFVAPSIDVADNEKLIGRRAIVIKNWVDNRYFESKRDSLLKSAGPVTVVIVGNSSYAKNHIAALRPIHRHGLRLAFYGSEQFATPEEKEILDSLQAEGRLVHRGVADPLEALLEADYFVMPSRNEGMPVALIEAICVGIPAIVSDVPGFRWSFDYGNVFRAGVSNADWDLALREIAAREFPHSSGSGRSAIEQHRAHVGAAQYVSLYRTCLVGLRRWA